MIRLLKNELLKLWMKKAFWGIFLFLLIINIFLLWYTIDSQINASSPSAYTRLHQDIKDLSEVEKAGFIEDKLKTITAMNVWEEIHMFETLEQSEYTAGRLEQIKEENPEIEAYKDIYYSKAFLTYTDTLESETKFIEEINDEISKVSQYPAMLDSIEKQAKILASVSIFGGSHNDNFSSRNIKKTAKDYETMRDTPIVYDVSKGFTTATNFLITDIIAVLLMFFLSTLLIYDEKDKELFSLIKSTASGRGPTIIAKIGALGINMLIITVAMFGANLLFTGFVYGFQNLGVTLQSIPEFINSTLHMNAGQYLLLFLFSKFIAYFTVSLFVLLVALFARHPAVTYLISGSVLFLSFMLYQTIPSISNFNIFKYINLVSFVRTNELYQDYLNLNLFEHPVNLIAAIWAAIAMVFVFLAAINLLVFCIKRKMQAGEIPFKKFVEKITVFRFKPSASVMRHESYKLLVVNKVGILIVIFILFQWYANKDSTYYYAYDELYYQNYMKELEGRLTPEKEGFMKQEQKKYEDAEESLNALNNLLETGEMTKEQVELTSSPYEKILLGKSMFDAVKERYDYILENPDAQFVYDTGYNRLFGISGNNDDRSALILVLLCILCFSGVFPMEYKNNGMHLIRSTPLGRGHTCNCKMVVCILALIPIFIAVYLPDFLLMKDTFGSLNAPVMSLPALSHLPVFLPIWGYLFILYLTRFAACVIMLLAILAISKMAKNNIFAMIVSGFLLAVPIILWMMNLKFIYPVTGLSLLTTNSIFIGQYKTIFFKIYIIIVIGIGVGSILINRNVLMKDNTRS